MKYFKKSELIKLYNVSDKTVRNWIEATKQGKLDLKLIDIGSKAYICDTLTNGLLLEKLSERSKKYRNSLSHRTIKPTEQFYKVYDNKQISDVVNSLETSSEIPHQYRYFDQGAAYWDAYLRKLYNAGAANSLSATVQLLNLNQSYLNDLLSNYPRINIIDLGVGNGLATKDFIANLHQQGKLNKYIGIDVSKELLDITAANMRRWFGGHVAAKTYVRDLTYERFGDIIWDNSPKSVANVVLFLGGTISNFREARQVLATIRDSMTRQDLLITSLKLDSAAARRFFDFNVDSDGGELPKGDIRTLQLLSITPDLYSVEKFYDAAAHARFFYIRLKRSLTVDFRNRSIELQKGQRILLWRALHRNANQVVELLKDCGFSTLQFTQTPEEDFGLFFSKVKSIPAD